jgi:chromosomal replication initiation ATPase DnaA
VLTSAVAIVEALRARDLLGIVEGVCRRRGITLADLCNRGRTQAVARARHEVWWTLRHDPGHHFSLAEIGAIFGRDHATVLHGIDAHRARLADGPAAVDSDR